MAYDKVVDSAALDASLTAIADAIRAKAGTSDAMTLDGMAEAIAAISAGGGEGVFGESAASGSFTLSIGAASFTVEHGLGKTPTYALVFLGAQRTYSRTKKLLICAAAYSSPGGNRQLCVYGTTSDSDSAMYSVSELPITTDGANANALSYCTNPIYGANETTISFGDASGGNTAYLMSYRPYYWIVW